MVEVISTPSSKREQASAALVLRTVTASYAPLRVDDAPLKSTLDAVDLVVHFGEIVCVLGPNGAGKTTLVRVASGLLAPSSGEVHLLGEPLGALPRAATARILAVVEQTPTFASSFDVRSVVAMGRAPHQGAWMRAASGDDAIVASALERCDLLDLATRPANALSGGEQKRVAIARALAQEPRVLLLDEPGAFLDVRHQLELYELLVREVKRSARACLVVVHDLAVAAQYADRIVLMKAGRIVADGTVDEVMTSARLRETFDTEIDCGRSESGARYFLPRLPSGRPSSGPPDQS